MALLVSPDEPSFDASPVAGPHSVGALHVEEGAIAVQRKYNAVCFVSVAKPILEAIARNEMKQVLGALRSKQSAGGAIVVNDLEVYAVEFCTAPVTNGRPAQRVIWRVRATTEAERGRGKNQGRARHPPSVRVVLPAHIGLTASPAATSRTSAQPAAPGPRCTLALRKCASMAQYSATPYLA